MEQETTCIFRSPPNIQDTPQPLIIVDGLIQDRHKSKKNVKPEVDISSLEQVAAISTETHEDQCHICLDDFKFADKLDELADKLDDTRRH